MALKTKMTKFHLYNLFKSNQASKINYLKELVPKIYFFFHLSSFPALLVYEILYEYLKNKSELPCI